MRRFWRLGLRVLGGMLLILVVASAAWPGGSPPIIPFI
jgi:hypothetical protein